ncbi:MAG: (S)-ureidoglycine aminohydrolase [Anaerolineales bacterium]|jgi:(S)-ureidoglycine aminohydrolase
MQKGMMVVSDADITSRCRSRNKPGEYMLLPRGNRVEHKLPHFQGVDAQVLTTPQIGALFVEHELLIQPNGGSAKPKSEDLEQFFFVLEGEIDFELEGKKQKMVEGGFCWLPPKNTFQFINKGDSLSRVVWVRRRYEEVEGISIPDPIFANEKDVPAKPVDTYMEQHLTPYEDLAFDLGINLQVFDPGVYFSFVESHVMEHGLYMLYGRGVYWLNGEYIEVQKDDYIYMAPWCPQFFYATGWDKSAYLLYKDVNRDYTQSL